MVVPEIDARSLAAELAGENPPRLLDVREPDELAISRLPDIVHVPLTQLGQAAATLDRGANWVVVCRSGGRSAQATTYLQGLGFTNVRNLSRGMNGYAKEVDRTMKMY